MSHRWDFTTHSDRFKYLNIAQLRDLLEDEETVEWIIRINPKIQDLHRQKEIKWGSNRRLAERNLSYRPFLNNKLVLADRYRVLGQLISSVKQKHWELDHLHGRLSLKTIQRFLEEMVINLTGKSEDVWNTFIKGDLLLAEFVESFGSVRRLYHKRLVEVEKIQEFNSGRGADARDSAVPLVRALHAPNALHVFHHLSPVVSLRTSSLLPLTGHSMTSRYLPPLNRHGEGDLWMPSIQVYDPEHSRERKTCPERLVQQYSRAIQDHATKHSQ